MADTKVVDSRNPLNLDVAAIERGETPPELQSLLNRFFGNLKQNYEAQGKQGIIYREDGGDHVTEEEAYKPDMESVAAPPSLEGLSEEVQLMIGSVKPGDFLSGNEVMRHADNRLFTAEELANAKKHEMALAARSCTPETPQRVVEGTYRVLQNWVQSQS